MCKKCSPISGLLTPSPVYVPLTGAATALHGRHSRFLPRFELGSNPARRQVRNSVNGGELREGEVLCMCKDFILCKYNQLKGSAQGRSGWSSFTWSDIVSSELVSRSLLEQTFILFTSRMTIVTSGAWRSARAKTHDLRIIDSQAHFPAIVDAVVKIEGLETILYLKSRLLTDSLVWKRENRGVSMPLTVQEGALIGAGMWSCALATLYYRQKKTLPFKAGLISINFIMKSTQRQDFCSMHRSVSIDREASKVPLHDPFCRQKDLIFDMHRYCDSYTSSKSRNCLFTHFPSLHLPFHLK